MKKFLAVLLAVSVGLIMCACYDTGKDDKAHETIAESRATLVLTEPTEGFAVSIANDEITEWFSAYSPVSVGENYGKGNHYSGKGVTLKWTCDKKADGYIIEIKEKGAKGSGSGFYTTENSFTIDGLNVNSEYNYTISAKLNGETIAQIRGKFETMKTPKFIVLDGVSNMRDVAFFSKQLKQGMIYRSAAFDDMTTSGAETAAALGIKTDIDLRNVGEGLAGSRSPISGATYHSIPGAYYIESAASILDPTYQRNMAKAIELFADEKNYPIVFHCAIGRDRTGTLAAVLEAFLGADYNDILADYEASFFSEAGCRDNASAEIMVPKIAGVCDYLKNYSGGTLAENTEKFLTSIGVRSTSLSAIKKIMTK